MRLKTHKVDIKRKINASALFLLSWRMSAEDEILFEISDTNSKRNIEFKRRSPSDGNKKDCAKIEGSKIEFLNTADSQGTPINTKF